MLRPAQKTDFERIFEIYMDPTVNPYMNWELMPLNEFRPIFDEILLTNALYAYEVENNLIAVIRLERKKYRLSHIAYIGGFGIHSDFQNQGLGLKIIREVITKFKTEGVLRIELIVESDNPKAIHLYEKLGFKKEGTLRRYFKRKDNNNYVEDYYMSLLLET